MLHKHFDMRNATLITVSASLLLVFMPTTRSSAFEETANSGFVKIALTGAQVRAELLKGWSVDIIEVRNKRDFIYVELLRSESNQYRFRILPSTVDATYDIIINMNAESTNGLRYKNTESDLWTEIKPASSSNNESSYRFTANELQFKTHAEESQQRVATVITPETLRAVSSTGALVLGFDQRAILKPFTVSLSEHISLPGNADVVLSSDVTQYDIEDAGAFDTSFPVHVKLYYGESEPVGSKSLYYFDKLKQQWLKLPSYHHIEERYVASKMHFTYAPLALFTDISSSDGIASWYAYKNCLCAASAVYPRGTSLHVTRLLTGKSIEVVVNDYGPERSTGRTIDLDRTAFAQLGSTRAGLIYVNVKPND